MSELVKVEIDAEPLEDVIEQREDEKNEIKVYEPRDIEELIDNSLKDIKEVDLDGLDKEDLEALEKFRIAIEDLEVELAKFVKKPTLTELMKFTKPVKISEMKNPSDLPLVMFWREFAMINNLTKMCKGSVKAPVYFNKSECIEWLKTQMEHFKNKEIDDSEVLFRNYDLKTDKVEKLEKIEEEEEEEVEERFNPITNRIEEIKVV